MERVVREYPHLLYGDPALVERLGTIRNFSRTSKQFAGQVAADHTHRPFDVAALKPIVAGIFQNHGLQFTYSRSVNGHFYTDEAGQEYKLDVESCLADTPPALIYAYPFEAKGVRVLKWVTDAREVTELVLPPIGRNGKTPGSLMIESQPVPAASAVPDSLETISPAEETPIAEESEESEAMRRLWERLAGNYIANLQAHPDLMNNADLIAQRKDLGKEVPTPTELKLFYQRKLQAAGIERKRQAGEVGLALTDADIEEILRARSPQSEVEVAPPPRCQRTCRSQGSRCTNACT